MTRVRMSRGHPLVALLAVLGGWIGGRATTWEPAAAVALHAPESPVAAPGFAADRQGGPQSFFGAGTAYDYPPMPAAGPPVPMFAGYRVAPSPRWPEPAWSRPPVTGRPSFEPDPPSSPAHLADEFAMTDAFPRFYAPEPPGMARPQAATAQPALAPPRPRRWSADAWALLRRDQAGVASAGVLPATYGASQAGAVLRYRLALASRYRPTLYLRTTSSMGQLRETAAAFGFTGRPLPALPVTMGVEGRVTDQGGRRRFQPAALAVTELAPFPLPAGFRGEAYAQGGYVAGAFATPFADGQVRADHALVRVGKIDARVGAGVWGGAQKGAARLDAGPSASVTMPLSHGALGRVAVDWRFRLAGDAVPDSGPAVTLSAGF